MYSEAGELLVGDAVVEGAAEYSCNRGAAEPHWDGSFLDERRFRLRQIRCEARGDTVGGRDWLPTVVTPDIIEKAVSCVRLGACCGGLPYAVLRVSLPSARSLLADMAALAFDFGQVAADWPVQDHYHTLKPGRAATNFGSYRELGLNKSLCRLCEEVWVVLCGGMPWHAAGTSQDALKPVAAVVAVDMEVANIRAALGLPCGTFYADKKEAFDSTWREDMLVELYESAGVCGRLFLLADALISSAKISVVRGGCRSSYVLPKVGVVEGRKLSPVQYCVSGAHMEDALPCSVLAVGVNPPTLAVAAYHCTKDGSSGAVFDPGGAASWAELGAGGDLPWTTIMAQLPSDTMRLAVLDAASSVRVGLRMFVDDSRHTVASHGHAENVAARMDEVAAKRRCAYKFGAGKTEIAATGLP
ncbi:unnamed protein product [Polarella glacialis]|uniref:Uncharacterized protein n=1 Tax=Polarella glacialis TaxID=89957 RepID=A0A813JLM4_POLGL|nr:unnamed protein product [Polarella glacialis]